MKMCVVGLGYVGTVSAACLACKGHLVHGVDINAEKVRIINAGGSPIVEDGLAEKIVRARESGMLWATGDMDDAIRESEICFLAVATPSRPNGELDPSFLFRAFEQVANAVVRLDRSLIVVVRSSILPTAFDYCKAMANKIAPGRISLCANPEFLREGTAIHDFENPPLTLLGVDAPEVEAVLTRLYEDFPPPIYVLPPKEALFVKYASNVFHALKITFANEIGSLCHASNVDARAVMSVFCQDRQLNISERYLMPGFAFGGSCLPKDIRAVLQLAKRGDIDIPLIESLCVSNSRVIDRAVQRVIAAGARNVGLIGLSFKPNTDDLRESPYVEVAEHLLGKGYNLRIYDPNVSIARLTGANKEHIQRTIPHLSRLLVSSLSDLADCEIVIIGHNYVGVREFVENAATSMIDLTGDYPSCGAREEKEWTLSATF